MAFESDLDGIPVFDETNFNQQMSDALKFGRGLEPRDLLAFPKEFEGPAHFELPILSMSELTDRVEALEKSKRLKYDLLTGGSTKWDCKNQGQTPECWAVSMVGGLEMLRWIGGMEYIKLSGSCVAMKVSRFVKRGGYGAESLQQLMLVGTCEEKDWPEGTEGYKKSYDFDVNGSSEQAKACKKYRITGYWDIDAGDKMALATALVDPNCIALKGDSAMGHEFAMTDLAFVNNGFAARCPNTWGNYPGSKNGWMVKSGQHFFTRADDMIIIRAALPA